MHLAIAGSVAADHLQTFAGRFADSLVPDQLDKLSVSFLVKDLDVRRGGCAGNIAFALGALGRRPTLVAAVGRDFVEQGYQDWLTEAGVDCSRVHVSPDKHTALCTITTDEAHAQIVTFYPGAMSEAGQIDVEALHAERPIDLLLVGPDDPDAMLRHTRAARRIGLSFVADPSQQLAWADGDLIGQLIEGAAYLFTNDYEAALVEQKTGWSADQVKAAVGVQVVTRGADGVTVIDSGGARLDVAAIPGVEAVDPTGVGDAFRGGFLAGLAAGLDLEACAQLGCAVAASVVETTGTQEYTLESAAFHARLTRAYGDAAAARITAALP
ncbi:MAG: carbohydrate kinase family protein [Aeromicrobium sp.]|uniref:carbohydrate kinase family protein n=1 Tax=Aeromicrobium sp. TaxID=1871063 RepID=UPI0039E29BEC